MSSPSSISMAYLGFGSKISSSPTAVVKKPLDCFNFETESESSETTPLELGSPVHSPTITPQSSGLARAFALAASNKQRQYASSAPPSLGVLQSESTDGNSKCGFIRERAQTLPNLNTSRVVDADLLGFHVGSHAGYVKRQNCLNIINGKVLNQTIPQMIVKAGKKQIIDVAPTQIQNDPLNVSSAISLPIDIPNSNDPSALAARHQHDLVTDSSSVTHSPSDETSLFGELDM